MYKIPSLHNIVVQNVCEIGSTYGDKGKGWRKRREEGEGVDGGKRDGGGR